VFDEKEAGMKKAYETKAEIKKDIRSVTGNVGVLSVGEVARYMSMSRNQVMQLMEGYEYIKLGRRKLFTVEDLADRLLRDRRLVI
jgi:hypothetical protein